MMPQNQAFRSRVLVPAHSIPKHYHECFACVVVACLAGWFIIVRTWMFWQQASSKISSHDRQQEWRNHCRLLWFNCCVVPASLCSPLGIPHSLTSRQEGDPPPFFQGLTPAKRSVSTILNHWQGFDNKNHHLVRCWEQSIEKLIKI